MCENQECATTLLEMLQKLPPKNRNHGEKKPGRVQRPFIGDIFPPPTILPSLMMKKAEKMQGNNKTTYFLWLYNQSWFMMVMPLLIIL